MEEELLYEATTVLKALHNLLELNQLCSFEAEELEDWLEVTKKNFEEGTLPLKFRVVP